MTTKADLSRSLVCVEYPGIVENVDNMLHTLGGIKNISTAYSTRNRRLELRFRPDDTYCKPTCGDKFKTMALVLKIKIRRRKHPKGDGNDARVISKEVLGRVHTIYKFSALCDFQYLPVDKDKDDKVKYIYDDVVPNGMPSSSWIASDAPYFLTPATFSRIDSQQNVPLSTDAEDPKVPYNVIGRTRRRRSGHAVFVEFSKMEQAPLAANKTSINLLHVKFLNGRPLSLIKQLFEERPIWSRNALLYITKLKPEQLKYLIPAVAYYFTTGPWRVMWVRFGYDPRKDYTARSYQTLDYRIKTSGGLKTMVKPKRSYTNYVLPYKSSPSCRPRTAVITKDVVSSRQTNNQNVINNTKLTANCYIFRPGMLPSSRQMFYQYCDLKVTKIENMLDSLPIPMPGTQVDSKNGWMPPGFDEQCREIVHHYVHEALQKTSSKLKLLETNKAAQRSNAKIEEIEEEDEVCESGNESNWEDEDH